MDVLDSSCLLVLITGTSQSRQHVITSLIHIESCKSPTAELFEVDSGRIPIRHCPSCTGGGGGYSCLTCRDDSESDTEMPVRHVSPTPHDTMLVRWRSRVASRSSSPTTSTPEIPTSPIPPAPFAIDIPIGRLYHTHPGEPCRALTARKSVRTSFSSFSIEAFYFIHSLSRHTPPVTIIANSSAPLRFVYPPLARTSRYSEAYPHWRSDPLPTMYPPTTSESSAEDSSSESSAGPSRKRCRSSAATVTSSILDSGALVLFRAGLLPPRKRFRDSISPEDSVEEDIDADVLADIEADATAVEVAVDMDVEVGVDAGIGMEVDVGVDVEDKVEGEGEVESSDRGTIEVGVDMVDGIGILDWMAKAPKTDGGNQNPDRLDRVRGRVGGFECRYPAGNEAGTDVDIINEYGYGYTKTRPEPEPLPSLVIEIPLQRVEDIETGQRELKDKVQEIGEIRFEAFGFSSMMLCMDFRLVVELVIMTITRSGMTPKAIEELINQRVAEALAAYEANRAAELAVEGQSRNGDDDDNKNFGGNGNENGGGNEDENGGGNGNENRGGNGNGNPNLNDRGTMLAARECTYHDFVKCQPLNFKGTERVVGLTRWFKKMETLFQIKISRVDCCPPKWFLRRRTESRSSLEVSQITSRGYVVRNAENKRRLDNNQKDKRGQQPPVKRQNVRATQRAPVVNQRVPTCFECGRQGHYMNECPKLKKKTRGNKSRNKSNEARGKAYVLGGGEANLDSNVVTGTFLLNNHYAYMLFDLGTDRSFVSTTFSALLDVVPSTLDVSYAVELADEKVVKTNTVLRGCTLRLLGHPFNIDLMPIELGSFDVISGMDCLANHHAVIVCDEKIVQIPYGVEVLIVQAQVTKKETKDKSKEKRLEDVSIVQDFSEVFPEDLLGLPPTRQVEFQIDLVPGAAPVARAPYILAPSELQELSTQVKENQENDKIESKPDKNGKRGEAKKSLKQLQ
nr:putative reverse transcriptase domain-containing protein [Tanacetum cinerariifolium]